MEVEIRKTASIGVKVPLFLIETPLASLFLLAKEELWQIYNLAI